MKGRKRISSVWARLITLGALVCLVSSCPIRHGQTSLGLKIQDTANVFQKQGLKGEETEVIALSPLLSETFSVIAPECENVSWQITDPYGKREDINTAKNYSGENLGFSNGERATIIVNSLDTIGTWTVTAISKGNKESISFTVAPEGQETLDNEIQYALCDSTTSFDKPPNKNLLRNIPSSINMPSDKAIWIGLDSNTFGSLSWQLPEGFAAIKENGEIDLSGMVFTTRKERGIYIADLKENGQQCQVNISAGKGVQSQNKVVNISRTKPSIAPGPRPTTREINIVGGKKIFITPVGIDPLKTTVEVENLVGSSALSLSTFNSESEEWEVEIKAPGTWEIGYLIETEQGEWQKTYSLALPLARPSEEIDSLIKIEDYHPGFDSYTDYILDPATFYSEKPLKKVTLLVPAVRSEEKQNGTIEIENNEVFGRRDINPLTGEKFETLLCHPVQTDIMGHWKGLLGVPDTESVKLGNISIPCLPGEIIFDVSPIGVSSVLDKEAYYEMHLSDETKESIKGLGGVRIWLEYSTDAGQTWTIVEQPIENVMNGECLIDEAGDPLILLKDSPTTLLRGAVLADGLIPLKTPDDISTAVMKLAPSIGWIDFSNQLHPNAFSAKLARVATADPSVKAFTLVTDQSVQYSDIKDVERFPLSSWRDHGSHGGNFLVCTVNDGPGPRRLWLKTTEEGKKDRYTLYDFDFRVFTKPQIRARDSGATRYIDIEFAKGMGAPICVYVKGFFCDIDYNSWTRQPSEPARIQSYLYTLPDHDAARGLDWSKCFGCAGYDMTCFARRVGFIDSEMTKTCDLGNWSLPSPPGDYRKYTGTLK